MKSRMLLTAMMVIFGSISASFAKTEEKSDKCTEQFHKALKRYEKQRHHDVRVILDELKYQCGGHPAMDSILYYLGKSLLETKGYAEASVEFERLLQDYPRSVFAEEAHFRIGYASYKQSNPVQKDQSQTYTAMRAFSSFLEQRPESEYADSARRYIDIAQEKLAEKEYRNARFYERIEQYESAVVYFRDLIERFPRSKYIPEARFALAENLLRTSRPSEAEEVLQDLLNNDPPDALRRKATMIMKQEFGKQQNVLKQGAQPLSQEPKETKEEQQPYTPPIDEDTETIMIETTNQSEAAETEAAKSEATKSEATKSEATETEATETEATETETAETEEDTGK